MNLKVVMSNQIEEDKNILTSNVLRGTFLSVKFFLNLYDIHTINDELNFDSLQIKIITNQLEISVLNYSKRMFIDDIL